jgi:general secretion pathway protein L
MADIILGLDIGSTSVKAVLASFKSRTEVRILAHSVARFESADDLEAVLKKTAEAVCPRMPSRPLCVLSLAPSEVMFRQIRLPFRDENRIKKTLPFELEPLLPVPVEEVMADYLPLPDGGLLAAACRRERIRDIISLTERHFGDVAVIDISTAAQVLPLLDQKTAGGGLLLDVGAAWTDALFYERNAVLQIRSFAFGGDTITRALAEEMSCDVFQAEKMKIDGAYDPNGEKAQEACRTFCAEVARTVEALRFHDILHGTIQQVTLTGGGALFAPLQEHLGKAFGRPVELFDVSRYQRVSIDDAARDGYSPQAMNGALAVATRARATRKSFNFRQGDFAVQNILGDFRGGWTWVAGVICAIVCLAAADIGLSYALQKKELSDLKNQIAFLFKKNAPQGNPLIDPVGQLKAKLLTDQKAFGLDQASEVLAIDILREVSSRIPSDLQILIYHFHYENHWVLLKGEAQKVDDIAAVKNALLKSNVVKNVVVGSTRLAKDGGKVDFDLKLELK